MTNAVEKTEGRQRAPYQVAIINAKKKFVEIVSDPKPESAEAAARRFHEAYERLAPQFGYGTRPETRKFDPTSANGRLMIAVCAELQAAPQPPAEAQTMPDWGAAPPGATHYQPHQDAYYKRVSASEWYVWSREDDRGLMRWLPSLGTRDNAEWVVRPAEAQPVGRDWCEACVGEGWTPDVADPFARRVCCPDCAGSGLAETSITANEAPPPSAPVGVADAWQEGYRQGVLDERISEANIGIAGFNAKVEPARVNPYLAQQPAAVDEAMVDRGLAEYRRMGFVYDERQGIRNILTAALAAKQGGDRHG